MLGLPRSTEVNRRVAKDKIYTNTTMTAQLRDIIKNQIESIIWRNKLSATTLGLASGEDVKEIQVFEIALRQRGLDKRALTAITKAIPYKILFVLTFGDVAQTWIEASGTFYNSDWFPIEGFTLKFDGLNIDTFFESIARQIASGRLDSEGDLTEAVERDKLRQKLEREIAGLETKVMHEKQFNRQIEQNSELKRLRAELEGMG